MANGYIGKISAVVTASTADLERKLRGAKGEVERFGRSLNSTIASASRSAENSLNGIFTPLQKLQRALQAGSNGRLNLVSERDVARIQQLTQAAREVAAPLKGVAADFDRISNAISGEFTPALNLAQQQTKLLERGIQTFGGVSERAFTRVRQRAEETAQSFSRIREAASAASGLATGQELRFTNPSLVAENARAAALQSRAASLTPDQITGNGIAGLVAQQRQASEEAARLQASLENIRATRRGDAAEAERALAAQVAAYGAVNAQLDEQIARLGSVGVEQQARLAAANQLLQVDQRESQLTSLEGLASTRDATGRSIQERARDIANEAEATERRRQAEAALRSEQEARLAVANSLLQVDQRESELLSLEGTASGLGGRLARQGRDRVTGLTRSLNLDANDRFGPQAQRDIDALATRVGAVRQQLETLPNSVRTRFVPELQRAQEQLVRLQNAPAATVAQIERATQRVQRLEQSARRAAAAFNFRNSFGGAGLRGIEEGLNQQALSGYTAQLQILQRTLAGTSQAARGPAVVAFNNLRNAIADAMERGTLETEQTRRVLQQLTREAVQATARVAGVSANRLGQQLQRAGDVARGAAGNVGLAVQQAIFAVDDFFSVTGGLDQRIRAAGNNISQLAFILGGTYGLAAGVAITVTGQLVAGLIRYYNEGRTADDVTKALNDSLEKQIDLAKQLKDALRDVFDGVIEGGFSEQTRELRQFRKELDEIREKQRQQREEAAINANPDVVAARQEVNAAQRAIEEAQAPGQFILARQRLERARAREQAARQAAITQPGVQVGQAVRRSLRLEEAARTDFESGVVIRGEEVARRRQRAEDALARAEQQRIAGDQAGAINTQREEIRTRIQELSDPSISGQVEAQQAIVELQSILDRLELGLVEAIDNVVAASLENSFAVGREIARVQSRAGEAGAFGAQAAIDQANAARDAAARQLEEASRIPDVDQRQAAVAEASAGLNEADKKAQEVANKFNSVISSVETFKSALDRVSSDLANTVAQEARGAADQARRDVNAATAREQRLGSPAAARDAEFADRRRKRLEDDAKAAESERFRIQQENSRIRQQFEADAAAGNLGADAQKLIRQRDEAQAVLDDQNATAAQRAEATRRRDRANLQLDRQFENSPDARAARARADAADVDAQRRRQLDADITRGRELAETPAAAAGRELADSLRGLDAFFSDQVAGGALNRQEADAQLAEARRRQIDEAFRSQAPAIAGLADSVANAVLQGPSRAALNATDVSTVEGARELNRLIRGDDAARDQNLEELRRQSQQLDQLIQAVKDNGGDIAN